ncbi:hypothetical protein TELCIR_05144 [Teladorsagia circumcincta]|uniref:Uncharacterized protein n=1 Tax=Teladorsagia circumcincta TaxID=45464 RepID=A0A2G9UTQ6_TELCI|nr:hypothetical protein TELCIR_05144 [Teladorsagia circumcincta]
MYGVGLAKLRCFVYYRTGIEQEELEGDLQLKLITHAYVNVNMRPKYMTILTKSMNAEDLTHFIKIAFDSADNPPERTLFRLYCKNPVPGLKALLRAILSASNEKSSIEVEYSEVLGEMLHKGSKIRSKTQDLKAFCKVEELGRSLGMRFLTTFECRSTRHHNRLLHIRYYDEIKPKGERVIYLHMDHEAFRSCGIKFSDVSKEIPYEVEAVGTDDSAAVYVPSCA